MRLMSARNSGWILTACLCTWIVTGCGEPAAPPKTSPAPATVPATQSATTEPATSKPSVSFMLINGKTVAFPLAKLRVDRKGSRVTALLFSDDPKDAINANYDGNSFYLEMDLDTDDVEDLAGAMWSYKSKISERQDSPYGIFLNGHKKQLQPMDVRALFEVNESATSIHIAGRFMSYTDDENVPPEIIAVDAKLPVDLILKKD